MVLVVILGCSAYFCGLGSSTHLVTMVVDQPAIGFDSHHMFFERGPGSVSN
jgi:hypothetical protein